MRQLSSVGKTCLEINFLLMDNQIRHDPIGDQYFSSLRIADQVSGWLFYCAAALSFAALLVDKKEAGFVYDIVQVLFVLAVIAVFFIGLVIRLYLTPRAEDMRRKDLLSKAFGVPLTHEQSVGYYNNNQSAPIRFLGVAYLENSFFSKSVLLKMARRERIKVAIYLVCFLVAILNRNTDLAFAATAAAAVFSEQILARWFRLEWLRARCEGTYENLYALFQSSPSAASLHAKIFEAATFYETGKANAGITLSENIFLQTNPTLSIEWEHIKRMLKLD